MGVVTRFVAKRLIKDVERKAVEERQDSFQLSGLWKLLSDGRREKASVQAAATMLGRHGLAGCIYDETYDFGNGAEVVAYIAVVTERDNEPTDARSYHSWNGSVLDRVATFPTELDQTVYTVPPSDA